MSAQRIDAAGGYSITRLGLTGTGYSYNVAGGASHTSTIDRLNAAGQAIGETVRSKPNGDYFGDHAWFFNGTSTQALGLVGGVNSYTTADGLFRRSDATALNNGGKVVGESLRFTGVGDILGVLGRDAWLYDGASTQTIGPFTSEYQKNVAGGVYRFVSPTFINDAGAIVGIANRFGSGGEDLGNDTWLYNVTGTKYIGPLGAPYQYDATGGVFRYSLPSGLNSNGQAMGYASRFGAAGESLGSAAWFYNGTLTQAIGLTDSEHEYSTAAGIYRAALPPQGINSAGRVIGAHIRFNSTGENRGLDAWLFNGTTTTRIGLAGSGYEFSQPDSSIFRYSSVLAILSESGWAAGTSLRFSNVGQNIGQDAWISNGTTNQIVGLFGGGYEYSTPNGIYRASGPAAVNEAGQSIGISARFDSAGNEKGQSGWFYDLATGVTTPLAFSVQTGTNVSSTTPYLLSNDGKVFGVYEKYNGATSLGEQLFVWSLAGGLQELGPLTGLIDGGLAAAGWQSIDTFSLIGGTGSGGLPKFLAGTGHVAGQAEGSSIYLLSAKTLLGDYNNDHVVNAADYTVWRNHSGQGGFTPYTNGDGTGDGNVTRDDYNVWKQHFGQSENLPGDYNNNHIVDAADYAVWRNHLGQTGFTPYTNGDGNGDGNVTREDYNVWKSHYGQTASGSGAWQAASDSAVPETSSALLLLIGLIIEWTCQRHRPR